MADTKQATPGELANDIWVAVKNGSCLSPASLSGMIEGWLASRSGPDRTTRLAGMNETELANVERCDENELQEARRAAKTAGYGSGSLAAVIENLVTLCASAKENADRKAGPDRGQQREQFERWQLTLPNVDRQRLKRAGECYFDHIIEARWQGYTADRGQQDAPELAKECQDLRAWKESAMRQLNKASRLMAILPTPDYWGWDVYDAAIDYIEKLAAKAAREGQEPKGDRIKVEREPGCTCEYAIWTNAKGCPLHDVSDPVQAQKE